MAENETVTCIQGKNPMNDPGCSRIQCKTCGWNPEVQNQRNALRKTEGLKLCEDGLHRLVLERTEVPASEEENSEIMSTNERECVFCGTLFKKHRFDQKCCSTACGRKLGAITAKEKRNQKKEST